MPDKLNSMYLSELRNNESAYIAQVGGSAAFRLRLGEMGFVPGQEVKRVYASPFGSSMVFAMLGQKVALRKQEAARIEIVLTVEEAMSKLRPTIVPDIAKMSKSGIVHAQTCSGSCSGCHSCDSKKSSEQMPPEKDEVNMALVGNPNCGKTAFFNAASGGHERTGNYAGITVSSVVGRTVCDGQKLRIVDLPGTYSLNAFSPEEAYVANELGKGEAQVIVNVLDVTNLERNLLLTLQLRKYHIPMVGVLNMYDEFESSGSKLDIPELEKRLGMKLVPTVASKGVGVKDVLREAIEAAKESKVHFPDQSNVDAHLYVHKLLDGIYELHEGRSSKVTQFLDNIFARTPLAFLFSLLIMWFIFYVTFEIGAYPMDWLDQGVGMLKEWLSGAMAPGWLRDLLLDGILGGVGAVFIFLPNILILYFFISILEDSGYLSRAALLFDPLLRRVGLHGKSFVPMLMGFGCSVPAVMATRTIENYKSRILTIMAVPMMSCSARIPVYTVLSGAFFPDHAALVMMCLYLGGIIMAFFSAWMLNKVYRRKDESHFVMEMPPYRWPIPKSVLRHTWEKGRQYLKKMGGIILIACVIIWVLGYFPSGDKNLTPAEQQEQSYLGIIGHAMEPVIEPLGYDWRMGVGILSGVGAKELMVSTMGVLYNCEDSEDEDSLRTVLSQSDITSSAALSYLVFALLYFPCLATLAAIKAEAGRWRYAVFAMCYTTILAYIMAFIVYRIALPIIG